jgi:glycosyltransferase involved in cell wall biosynthesis
MRIGLNLLPVVPGVGGSWNYAASLLNALAAHDRENEYVALVTSASAPIVPAAVNFHSVEMPLHASWRPLRVAFENTLFRSVVRSQHLDCIHHLFGTMPFGGPLPTVVTIHDFMVFSRPGDFSLTKRMYLRFMYRRAARRAAVLAPVSMTTARDIQRLFSIPAERMHVVRAAIGAHFTRASEARVALFKKRLGLPPTFWLCVAEPYANKNYARLIEAFSLLRRSAPAGWPLVIRSGLTPQLRQQIRDSGLSDQVIIVPRLPDADMPLLYSAAAALVFASTFEGGGLPVVEALACGCPVVASNIPTTREFADDAVETFDPLDVGSITAAMKEFEHSPEMRQRLRLAAAATTPLLPHAMAGAMMAAYDAAVTGHS